jgi:hypothetical protein
LVDQKSPGGGQNPLKRLFGRKTGIDLDEELPDIAELADPDTTARPLGKPPVTDADDDLAWPEAGAGLPQPPAGKPAAPVRPGSAPRPEAPAPPRPPKTPGYLSGPLAPRPLPRDPYSATEFDFLRDEGVAASRPAEEAPAPPERPRPRETTRLDPSDLNIGNLSGSDDSGAKYKSDRARWW